MQLLLLRKLARGMSISPGDPLLRYLGSIEGPADLSMTVDTTVYGKGT